MYRFYFRVSRDARRVCYTTRTPAHTPHQAATTAHVHVTWVHAAGETVLTARSARGNTGTRAGPNGETGDKCASLTPGSAHCTGKPRGSECNPTLSRRLGQSNNILTYRVAVGFLSRAAALQYNSPTTPVARCGTALSLRARRAAFARADVAKDLEDAHRRTRSSRVEGGRAVPSALVMRSSHVVRGNGTHVGQVRPALPPHTSALAHSARVRRHAAS